jgi:hypothetical protein
MNFQRTAMRHLTGIIVGTAAIIAVSPAPAKTNQASAFDPLRAFVGTWVATKPNESTPYLVLKLKESDGKLAGTISHFKIGVVGDGRIIGSPLPAAESPVSDVIVKDGEVEFSWDGDPPLHGGPVRLVVQGTKVAYLLISVSAEEMERITSDSPGASGFAPILWMRRNPDARNAKQEGAGEKWEVTTTARLVNAAEFQYKLAKRIYADYPTLVRSGKLRNTAMRQFTLVPRTLQSVTDPLPGYVLHLLVSADGSSYQLSIRQKTAADCSQGVFSDETGIVFDGRSAECSVR